MTESGKRQFGYDWNQVVLGIAAFRVRQGSIWVGLGLG